MGRVGRKGGGGYRSRKEAPFVADVGVTTELSRNPASRNSGRTGENPEADRKIARERRKQLLGNLWESRLPVVIRDHPNPALVPVGDTDIYTNPPGAVDPQNCTLWPDSPFCGGTGTDLAARKFFDLSPQIEIAGGCEICISLAPVIGFASLPPIVYCYRKPECQVPVDKFKKSPPGPSVDAPLLPPRLDHVDDTPRWWVITTEQEMLTTYERTYEDPNEWRYFYSKNSIAQVVDYLLIPDSRGIAQTPWGEATALTGPTETWVTTSLAQWDDINNLGARYGTYENLLVGRPDPASVIKFVHKNPGMLPGSAWNNLSYYPRNELPPTEDAARWFSSRYPNWRRVSSLSWRIQPYVATPNVDIPFIIWGAGDVIKDVAYWLHFAGNRTQRDVFTNGSDTRVLRTRIVVCPLTQHDCDNRLPPAPPQPLDKMSCDCQAQEELLRLIYKKLDDAPQDSALLQRVADTIGVEEYPASVPASFVTRSGKPEGQIQISNLSQLLSRFIQYFDEVLGHWEQTVTISDTDLTEEGDQSTTVKLPNVAETLSEGFGMLVNLTTLLQANLETSVAALAEAGASHRIGVETRSIVEGVEDFLAYEYETIKEKEPFAFDPGQEEFSKMLKPREVDLKVHRFKDKQDFKSYNTEYLQGVAMIRAYLWKNIDPNGDIQQQIRDWIGEAESLLQDEQERQNEDFDTFLNKTELGFFLEPGSTNLGRPYGRDYERRPRIREIGGNQTD